jgi:hypothetical protein
VKNPRFLLGEFGKIGSLFELFGDRLGLVLGLDQDMPGVHFLLAGDLLGGVLVDLLHGLVGGGGLALGRQQAVHQEPVARKRQPLLEILVVFDLFVFSRLGYDLHVDQERQHVFLLGGRVHLREARSKLLLGQSDVALADFGAVDLGEHRVRVLGAERQSGEQHHGEAAGGGGRDKAEARAGFRFRERSGHGKSFIQRWGCLGRRDTRPIMWPWQREKPVKMMKSLTASRR